MLGLPTAVRKGNGLLGSVVRKTSRVESLFGLLENCKVAKLSISAMISYMMYVVLRIV